MNREIKFRAWDKEGNKMISGDNFAFEEYAPLNDLFHNNFKRFDFMQYTGCKDGNGVEIYEGDIIETHEHRIQTIIWEDNGFKRKYTFERTFQGESYFETRILEIGDSSNRNWGYKVIGNIYENKELLEVE
jgi:uncharacterized phage protein (TIGR01671 family)